MPYLPNRPDVFYRRWTADDPHSRVLLLHGFGEHTGHYQRLAAELTRRGHDVWAPDHHGHGLSGNRDGMFASVEALEVAAAAVLDESDRSENADKPRLLIGHSLGGLVAAALAADRSESVAALVLTGTPIAGRSGFVTGADEAFSRDPSYLDDLKFDPLAFDTVPAESNLWDRIDAFLAGNADLPSRLPMPVLVVSGELDLFTSVQQARAWSRLLPNGTFLEVPGGLHDIVNDRAHRYVATSICEFFASALAAGNRTSA